jgi:hypothetical protein
MFTSGSFFGIANKFWEVQAERFVDWDTYFNFQITFNRNCDHAGFRFCFEICGLWLDASIYDCRHWDYDNKDWHTGDYIEE